MAPRSASWMQIFLSLSGSWLSPHFTLLRSLRSVAAGRMPDAQREPREYWHTDPSGAISPRITLEKHCLETFKSLGFVSWCKDSLLVPSHQPKYSNWLSCKNTHLSWSDRWKTARSRSEKLQRNFIVLIQFIKYLSRACYVPSSVLVTVDRMLCPWTQAGATVCLEASGGSLPWSSVRTPSTRFLGSTCLRWFWWFQGGFTIPSCSHWNWKGQLFL